MHKMLLALTALVTASQSVAADRVIIDDHFTEIDPATWSRTFQPWPDKQLGVRPANLGPGEAAVYDPRWGGEDPLTMVSPNGIKLGARRNAPEVAQRARSFYKAPLETHVSAAKWMTSILQSRKSVVPPFRMEARMKLSPEMSAWDDFWTWTNVIDPTTRHKRTEFDIAEVTAYVPHRQFPDVVKCRVRNNVHWSEDDGKTLKQAGMNFLTTCDWHVFGVTVDKDLKATFDMDGKVTSTLQLAPAFAGVPQSVILSHDLGGTGRPSTPDTVDQGLAVDYVKVIQQ